MCALQFGANLLLSPFAGSVFNCVGTKPAMAVSATASAVVGGVLALAAAPGAVDAALVFVGAGPAGVASAITTPGLQVLMQEVLERHEVSTAVVVQSAGMTLARAIGPAVAGIWLVLDLDVLAYLTHGLGYGLFAAALAAARTQKGAGQDTGARTGLRRLRALPMTSRQRVVLVGLLGLTFAVAWGADPINTLPLSTMAFAGNGAGFVLALTSITSALQEFPDRRGIRDVMGLWSAAFIGGRLPASLANGGVADLIGVVPATVLVGAAVVGVGLVAFVQDWDWPS